MFKLIIPPIELFDEESQEFVEIKEVELQLEHSLVSLSKWESKWCKPFLTKDDKTPEETIDYIRMMTITQNVDPKVYNRINQKLLNEVITYIEAPMTATKLPKSHGGPNKEVITSEIIYYWMISFQIPFECQKWHLNRLLTLIDVCNIKNAPNRKLSKGEIFRRNRELNAIRRAKANTSG